MSAPASVQELLAGSTQLFSLPDIYFQLSEMVRDPRFSTADIGKVIAKDPGLSARLLRLVNSPFYGFQAKIDTISRAITVVGIDELYNLVVATCVVERFDKIPGELVDMTAFWIRSVHCGVVAKLLAKLMTLPHGERLFLAGLLHDIGSLVLYQKLPEQSLQVLLAAGNDRRLLAGFEIELIGFTHADVARELIKSWGLPDSLYEPIGCYLNPEEARMHKQDCYVLNTAAKLVDAGERSVPMENFVEELPNHVLEILRLERAQLLAVMERSSAEFLNVFEMVAPKKQAVKGY